jgi:hypothetical protein
MKCRATGTPAMEAGITDHIWTLEEFVSLMFAPFQA